ncbi:Netrin receptor UNC5C [Stylophora pistillata]|uniref:Netrin receptor UNC5C n=1 Tax=Stylophora pistillata TaxID=50429 RepID=A0A2B4SI35_STYPI|nr:Netrin receptor UNC5C [Stylophora pistillata]
MCQVSDKYKAVKSNTAPPAVVIEHSCLVARGHDWKFVVKCRTLSSHQERNTTNSCGWREVTDVFPDARVEQKHNDIVVTFPQLKEDIEIAAFGIPGTEDQKRMKMAIFGEKPTQGRDWKLKVYLIDDSTIAFKNVCDKEESFGNNLLTTLAGLFVSNSNEDIRIEINPIETGWKVKGNKVQGIKAKDAWHSLEHDSTGFPHCQFNIEHVGKSKQAFFCGITASHGRDQANTELVAYFEQERSRGELNQPSETLQTLNTTTPYVKNGNTLCSCSFQYKNSNIANSIGYKDIKRTSTSNRVLSD